MKTTLLLLFLFLAATAFGQVGASLNGQGYVYTPPEHPQHASYAPLASEQTVLAGSGYTLGQGDRPASDFPQMPEASLGEAARELRKQHQAAKKSNVVWTNI
jgi:hypothetical protein